MASETKTTTLHPAGGRENNFPLIRLTAAVFVFAGHMGLILGGQPPLLGGLPLHELGVGMLFLISGYLITKSWLSDPHPLRFAVRRFLRLWPPFAVLVLLLALAAGPLLSSLGPEGYFRSGWAGYLRNLRFYIVYALPGVFTDLPLPNSMNGSLWTMPVEAGLYVLTPVLLTVMRVKKKGEGTFPLAAAIAAAAILLDICVRTFRPDAWIVVYGTELVSSWHLVVFYLIGVLFTYEKARRFLNLQAGCALMCLMLLGQYSMAPLQQLVMYTVFPYFIFSLAFAPQPLFRGLDRRMELSYGIYLYGFFFQQLTVYFRGLYGWELTYTEAFLISAAPTVLAAALSCCLVEEPCRKLTRYLVGKLKAGSTQEKGSERQI